MWRELFYLAFLNFFTARWWLWTGDDVWYYLCGREGTVWAARNYFRHNPRYVHVKELWQVIIYKCFSVLVTLVISVYQYNIFCVQYVMVCTKLLTKEILAGATHYFHFLSYTFSLFLSFSLTHTLCQTHFHTLRHTHFVCIPGSHLED